jgi:hypothetical protein
VGARRWGRPAAFAAGLLALTLASIGLGSRLRTPEQAAADAAAPSPTIVTAEVVRRVLSDASLAPGKGEEEGTIVALIRLSSPLPDRAFGESVRVTIRADRTGGPVVAVPITAVWQRADGTAWVTVVRSDGSMHDLQVRPGPAVGGYVPVEAVRGELAAGDDVRVG